MDHVIYSVTNFPARGLRNKHSRVQTRNVRLSQRRCGIFKYFGVRSCVGLILYFSAFSVRDKQGDRLSLTLKAYSSSKHREILNQPHSLTS